MNSKAPPRPGLGTPKTPKNTRPQSRLGPVQPATPTPQKRMFPVCNEFLEARKRRQMRHAAYLSKQPEPTLIVGGVNPFDQKNTVEAMKKFREAIAQKFFPKAVEPIEETLSTKLVFRDDKDDDDDDVVILGGGEGDGIKKNNTIVIDE